VNSGGPFELVLCDLDGTLLTPEREIRPANRALFAELVAAGVRVGLATGRAPKSALPHAERAGVTGPLILFNGAMIWDLAETRPVFQRGLTRADGLAVIEVALQSQVHVNVYMGDEIWIARVTETSRRSEIKDGVPHRVEPDLLAEIAAGTEAPVKLMLIDEDGDVMRLAEPIRAVLTQDCTLVHSEPTYLEVLAPGVSKGSALGEVTRRYGIAPEAIIAFGDQPNDLELLARCGLGVAMGNSHPEVKDIADEVIGDHTGDAIAEFLRGRFEVTGDGLVLR